MFCSRCKRNLKITIIMCLTAISSVVCSVSASSSSFASLNRESSFFPQTVPGTFFLKVDQIEDNCRNLLIKTKMAVNRWTDISKMIEAIIRSPKHYLDPPMSYPKIAAFYREATYLIEQLNENKKMIQKNSVIESAIYLCRLTRSVITELEDVALYVRTEEIQKVAGNCLKIIYSIQGRYHEEPAKGIFLGEISPSFIRKNIRAFMKWKPNIKLHLQYSESYMEMLEQMVLEEDSYYFIQGSLYKRVEAMPEQTEIVRYCLFNQFSDEIADATTVDEPIMSPQSEKIRPKTPEIIADEDSKHLPDDDNRHYVSTMQKNAPALL